MTDDGDTKDDVKVPDNEVGEKIKRMFREEEKDCSESCPFPPRSVARPVANESPPSRHRHPDCHG